MYFFTSPFNTHSIPLGNSMVRLIFFPTFLLPTELGSLYFWFTEDLSWQNMCCKDFCCWCFIFCFPFSLNPQSVVLLVTNKVTFSQYANWIKGSVYGHSGFNQHQNEGYENPKSSGSGTLLPNWLEKRFHLSKSQLLLL